MSYFYARYVTGPTALALALIFLMYQEDHADSRVWFYLAISGSALIAISFLGFFSTLLLNVVRKQYVNAISIVCGILIASIVLYGSTLIFTAIDYVRITVSESHYRDRVNKRHTALFDWGRSWNNHEKIYVLVYDETGEMLRPANMASQPIRQELISKYPSLIDGRCNVEVTKIRGHFYIASNASCIGLGSESR
jgi:xanthine/uracil permease